MPSVPPPTQSLAELSALLGEENVQALVRTFLRDFPASFRELSSTSDNDRKRAAHSMKSNSRLMGALELSARLAAIEAMLEEKPTARVSPEELARISTEFDSIASRLRAFAGH